jgi:hypothetical protein
MLVLVLFFCFMAPPSSYQLCLRNSEMLKLHVSENEKCILREEQKRFRCVTV